MGADGMFDRLDHRLGAVVVHPLRVEDLDPHEIVVPGADADLDRALGIDQPQILAELGVKLEDFGDAGAAAAGEALDGKRETGDGRRK